MTTVLVDCRISDACLRRLMILGFSPITLAPSADLPEAIASHPDTLFSKITDVLISSADYCDTAPFVFTDLRERHPSLTLRLSSDVFGKKYPLDCPFNALVLADKVYARAASISECVTECAASHGYEFVSVKQGYPACTTLAFESESGAYAITADDGMARTLTENGVKVTKISSGGISLPPYEYGFIGGASGVYKNKVYFLGDIKKHPDAQIILKTIADAGLEAVSLSDEPLFDGGGLIFID